MKVASFHIVELDLTSLNKLESVVSLYVRDSVISLSNPTGFPEGYGWNLNVFTDANGVTTIIFIGTYNGNDFTLTLETTLDVQVDEEFNEIILSL